MISFVVLLLICVKFGVSLSPAEVPAANPVNVKFSVDFTAEGGANSWKNDLSKFIYPENEAFVLDTTKDSEKVHMMPSFVVDKLNSLQEYESTLKNVSDKLNSLQEYENTLKNVSDKLNNLQEYENTLKNVFDKLNTLQDYENTLKHFLDQCKYLVGKSQIPLCRLNPVQTVSEAEHAYPTSCKEILKSGKNKSDVYVIKPKTSNKPFAVLCDMETKGGGWTHIQKRFDGSQDFYLPWRDYKFGFGDLIGEFWIGLENIYHMTAFETSQLLIEITATNKTNSYAQYKSFSIGNERDGYILNKLGGYSGDAGDYMRSHLNSKFSTMDVDLDKNNSKNCAQESEGAWWYVDGVYCHYSNLNGKFMTLLLPKAYNDHGLNYGVYASDHLAGSRMMIRPFGE
uniref:Ficolin-1-like n=1 Tax=Diabrotica virgifera virgifera TaxID=50390 RepID=A0A6P7EZ46_DIAVI